MPHTKLKSVAFIEHPVTDSYSTKAGPLDVLMNLDFRNSENSGKAFPVEDYCFALFQKIHNLNNFQLKDFINYQIQHLENPVTWLTSLDEFIVLNAQIFGESGLLLKVEKILFIIEFAVYKLNKSHTHKTLVFDFEQVKIKLKNISAIEDQLVYLHEIKAEYLQSGVVHRNLSEPPFDQKIIIEIKKIHELQDALTQVKNKHTYKNKLQENYIDNEDFIMMMKISKRTAQTWRDTGVISYSQVRNKIYYKIIDVEMLLTGNYIRSLKGPLG